LTVDTAAVRDARAKADAAYDAMVKRSCEAWKRPAATGRDAAEPNLGARPAELDPNAAGTVERQRQEWLGRDPAELARDLERRREAMRRKRAAAVANAWRTDPRRATTIERQGERWRGGR
jgi:hypothetical protein